MADLKSTLNRLEALSENESNRNRALIRAALPDAIEHFQNGLGFVALALKGPDPEFALYEFTQVMREIPDVVRRLAREVRS